MSFCLKCSAFPSEIAQLGEKYSSVVSIQNHILKVLAKYVDKLAIKFYFCVCKTLFACRFLTHIAEVEQFSLDVFWWACNCVRVMKAATEGSASSMEKVLFPLLRAMNRIAKDHSKQPQVGLLSAKGPPQESLSNSEFGTGAWFMYHALAGMCHVDSVHALSTGSPDCDDFLQLLFHLH